MCCYYKRPIKECDFDFETMGRKPVSEISRQHKEQKTLDKAFKEQISKCVSQMFLEVRKELDSFKANKTSKQ